MNLAIFDFDGTITDRDSFLDFIFFCHGRMKTIFGLILISPFVLLMVLKIWSRERAKERVFGYFFQDWKEERFEQMAQAYVHNRLPHRIRPKAKERYKWHKREGHHVVIVSASFENYLKFWTRPEEMALLATVGEVKGGKLTGKFASRNCHGLEKVIRLKAAYDLKSFEHIYAYGDTRGDLPLKTIAHEFHYKPFR